MKVCACCEKLCDFVEIKDEIKALNLRTRQFDLLSSKCGQDHPIMGFLLANFQLPTRPSVLDLGSGTGHTDGQTDNGHQCIMPLPGDFRSPQRRQRYSVGILLDIAEPVVARAAGRSTPGGHWLSGIDLHDHHVLTFLGPGVQRLKTG